MRNSTKTSVTKDRAKNSYTQVEYSPDFAFFSSKPDVDYRKMVERSVYDIAGTTSRNVRVYFNDAIVPVTNFKSYAAMFSPEKARVVHVQLNSRWEVAVFPAAGEDDATVPSFVNCMFTKRGGEHVKVMADVIHWFRQEAAKKCGHKVRSRRAAARPRHGQCAGGQPVVRLAGQRMSGDAAQRLWTDRVLSALVRAAQKALDAAKLSTWWWTTWHGARRPRWPTKEAKETPPRHSQLDDANKAGGPQSLECTLILTEGDSAKSTAIAGLSVVGRDKFGVFPLKGKLLNVRDASLAQRSKNAEIANLGKIMGITGVQPQDVSKLRYGSIIIMADQDVDGSHIKGLVLNWLDVYAPSLLQRPGFVRIFQTPIVRCTKRHQEPLEMFSVPEYEQWKASTRPYHVEAKVFQGPGHVHRGRRQAVLWSSRQICHSVDACRVKRAVWTWRFAAPGPVTGANGFIIHGRRGP